MPLQATSGAASYDGFGGGVPFTPIYIEDVFSTWLYPGNGSTQTINNGIDLAGKGGLVWCKGRPNAGYSHRLFDTARGTNNSLVTNTTAAQLTQSNSVTSFNAAGFSLGSDPNGEVNFSGSTYVSWTFRKQPKFFDVVTWTGNGASSRTLSHALNSAPGFIVVKRTNSTSNWVCYHQSLGISKSVYLDTVSAQETTNDWGSPTSTTFTVNNVYNLMNVNGATYVAYLFAHNAGGFGLTGTDNVISCGSWTDSGSGTQTITLGYEPQFVIYKRIDASSNWVMLDNMRGWPVVNAADSTANLYPNLSNAESGGNYAGNGPTATGFNMPTLGGGTYIYIAIRRGPMKTPTSGTSVFSPALISGTGSSQTISSPGFAPDLVFGGNRSSNPLKSWVDKLRGRGRVLQSYDTSAEASSATNEDLTAFLNTGFSLAVS